MAMFSPVMLAQKWWYKVCTKSDEGDLEGVGLG